ncbi:hypothetical protein WJX73_000480 [Symbiochloris irregularis]|uniref:Uncharacterized protein n=1 Tax=Symbiochloris irregularis TaxID=706552 RepID=A0AAW1NKQ8_9CHLO
MRPSCRCSQACSTATGALGHSSSPNPFLVVGIAAGGLVLIGFVLFALNKPPPEEKAGYLPKPELEKQQVGKALEPASISGKKPGVQVKSPGNTGNPN